MRPLEEFLYLSHRVSWNDNTLKSCFWSGIDDRLLIVMQAGNSICTLQQYIDYMLWLVGSPMMVGVVEEDFNITICMPTPHVPGPIHPEDILTPKPNQHSAMATTDRQPEPTTDSEPVPTTNPEQMPEAIFILEPEPTLESDQV